MSVVVPDPPAAEVMPQVAATRLRDCVAALTWRIWRRHRVALLTVPFAYFALIVGLVGLAVADPRIINGARGMAVVATNQFGVRPGHLAIAIGLAVTVVPSLVALQVAQMAANGVRSIIGSERSLGTMELLCASPASRRVLLVGVLTAPLLVAVVEWLLLTVPLTTAAAILLATLHVHITLAVSSMVALLVAPLPLAVLGGVLVLAVAIWRPRLTDQTVGPANNVLRLIGIAPVLAVLLLVTLDSRLGVARVVGGAGVAATGGCLAVVVALWRVFRPERILTL